MSRTIVERIKAECDHRKRIREAILRDRRLSNPSAEKRLPSRGAAVSQSETLAGAFTRDVVPVLSRAVSTEISAALDWVRRDLISCLERELTRATSDTVAESPPAAVEDHAEEPAAGDVDIPADQTETDLDLSASDVATQLDRVFAEAPADSTTGEERPVEAGGSAPRPSPPPAAAVSDESPAEELTASSETETLFLEPRGAPSDPGRQREPAQEPGVEADFEKRIETEIERQIEQALADPKNSPPPPSEAEAPSEPRTQPSREGEGAAAHGPPPPTEGLAGTVGAFDQPEARPQLPVPGPAVASAPGAIAQEVCEALVPGIADGISRVFEDLERCQEGIASRIESLGQRVEELVAPAKEAGDSAAIEAIRSLQEVLIREIRETERRMGSRLDAMVQGLAH